jgi:hypothetical protein
VSSNAFDRLTDPGGSLGHSRYRTFELTGTNRQPLHASVHSKGSADLRIRQRRGEATARPKRPPLPSAPHKVMTSPRQSRAPGNCQTGDT